jgi:hypothetical protein
LSVFISQIEKKSHASQGIGQDTQETLVHERGIVVYRLSISPEVTIKALIQSMKE